MCCHLIKKAKIKWVYQAKEDNLLTRILRLSQSHFEMKVLHKETERHRVTKIVLT